MGIRQICLDLHRAYELAMTYWLSKDSRYDRFRLLAVGVLTIIGVRLSIRLNYWKNDFYTALENFNAEQVVYQVGIFGILALAVILTTTGAFYLQKQIGINWRRHLSEAFLSVWMTSRTYYFLHYFSDKVDNPDQRIGEDVYLFVTSTLTFLFGILQAILTFASFVMILWTLSGVVTLPVGGGIDIYGYIVWIAFAYAVFGTLLAHKIGHSLTGKNYFQQKYEADFRLHMIQIREKSYVLTGQNSEKHELQVLKDTLQRAIVNLLAILRTEKNLTAFKSGYFQLANIFPVMVAVPLYIAHKINLGGLMQSASAFTRLQSALSYFVWVYDSWAEWQATVRRLSDFREHMDAVNDYRSRCMKGRILDTGDRLAWRDLTLSAPDGTELVKKASGEIRAGTSVLIVGDNGVGKTTFLKVLFGIWPWYSGTVSVPATDEMLLLTGEVYFPKGTLADIIAYPGADVARAQVEEWMQGVGMGKYIAAYETEQDWEHILSSGERQKINLLRALVRKPRWVLLDESSGALSVDDEQRMYEMLQRVLADTTIVSVGHRATLERYHDEVWVLADGVLRPRKVSAQ